MTQDNAHRAVSADGTEIVGSAQGQGPPLVLVHGGLGDGDTVWAPLLPHLTDHLTCYTMSTRGRGMSADAQEHTVERLVDDVVAFAESIGEPVPLIGLSSGALLSLGAAARSTAITAVVAYEPPVFEAVSEETLLHFLEVIGRVEETADTGHPAEASRIFLELVSNDTELAALERADVFSSFASTVPAFLRDAQGLPEGPSPTDPASLQRIVAPTLLLRGPDTALRWLGDGVDHVAAHVPNAQVRDLPGAGHLGPMVHPRRTAEEIVAFVTDARQPA